MTSAAKFDLFQEVTNQIIEAMEQGVAPWRVPFTGASMGTALPLRSNGVEYQGINVLMLWIRAFKAGFHSAHWFTFKQAQELGGKVRKGEKSSLVVKYGVVNKENDNGEKNEIPYLKAYRVFNADQIASLPETYYVEVDPARDLGTEPVADLEHFVKRTGALVETTNLPSAYYDPARDIVHMPPISTFHSAEGYYATIFHELAHWTGHRSRLDRTNGRQKAPYAYEELVAEIASCMIAARLNVSPDYDQSAAYLSSWLRALKNDKRFIFKAASEAQKAANFLMMAATQEAPQSAMAA